MLKGSARIFYFSCNVFNHFDFKTQFFSKNRFCSASAASLDGVRDRVSPETTTQTGSQQNCCLCWVHPRGTIQRLAHGSERRTSKDLRNSDKGCFLITSSLILSVTAYLGLNRPNQSHQAGWRNIEEKALLPTQTFAKLLAASTHFINLAERTWRRNQAKIKNCLLICNVAYIHFKKAQISMYSTIKFHLC